MAREPQNYTHNNQLSTSAENIIAAVASNTKEIVRKLSFTNTNTTTVRTVTVYIVETSGTADTGTTLKVKAISPNKTWNCIEAQGETLTTGMSLQAKQDTGTDVNANCSGTQVT